MKGTSPCPLCGVYLTTTKHTLTDRLYHTTNDPFLILECRGCGMLRLEPQPSPEHLAKHYPEPYWVSGKTRKGAAGIYRRFVLGDHRRFVNKALKRMGLRKAKARVLDLGCGAGDLLAQLRKKGHEAIGMDVSQTALRSAADLKVPVVRGDYHHPPFADATFDLAMMFHVMEHIPDPDVAVAQAHKMLRPKGRLLIQVPNADCMQYAILGRFWIGLDVPRHLYDYRRQDLEQILERNGFTVTRRKHFSWRDNPPALATSLAPWLDPMARRVRRPKRLGILRLIGDLMYFGLTAACWPFAVFEALFRRGATLMVEAEKIQV